MANYSPAWRAHAVGSAAQCAGDLARPGLWLQSPGWQVGSQLGQKPSLNQNVQAGTGSSSHKKRAWELGAHCPCPQTNLDVVWAARGPGGHGLRGPPWPGPPDSGEETRKTRKPGMETGSPRPSWDGQTVPNTAMP